MPKSLFGREQRACFPGCDTAAWVDGISVPVESLSVRSMNFGQHWRTPAIEVVSYKLEVPTRFFAQYVEAELSELIEDVRRHPDLTSDIDVALMRADFPSAEDALRDPVLAAKLAEYFADGILLRWIGDGPPKLEPGFVLNSIDRVTHKPVALVLEGKGRKSGTAVRYQDV